MPSSESESSVAASRSNSDSGSESAPSLQSAPLTDSSESAASSDRDSEPEQLELKDDPSDSPPESDVVHAEIPMKQFMIDLMREQVASNWTDTSMTRLFGKLQEYVPTMPSYYQARKCLSKQSAATYKLFPACKDDCHLECKPTSQFSSDEAASKKCPSCNKALFDQGKPVKVSQHFRHL